MKRLTKIGLIGTLCAISLGNLAFAADLPNEGKYDYTTCFTRTVTYVEYSPTQTAWSWSEVGRSVSDPSGSMFDGDESQCLGMTASLDGKRSGNTVCVGVAKDGAKRFTRFWYDVDGKLQRETLGGTGKYDGMVTTGTVQDVKAPPSMKPGTQTFEYCNRNTGTYKLKLQP
ncbi:MAG TPA: hypothetical protein VL742_06615 [Casimicrobiaceae bacterium]|nr:hypothetical protein [Casimicrobiaceae bacterium]